MQIKRHLPLRVLLLVTLCSLAGLTGIAQSQAESWIEQWDSGSSPWFVHVAPGASLILPNQADAQAEDGKALELRLAAGSAPGPGHGPEIETHERLGYGTYSTRLKTADCTSQPNAGVVTGYFVYFNDSTDRNQNGLPDNVEIDFEWLCAQPEVIYLTLWTDYRDADEAHRRVGRAINLQTGDILYSCYFEAFGACQALRETESQPAVLPALPGYASSQAYHVYGFDWSPSRVTWWMEHPTTGERIVLWDYHRREHIPPAPAYYMTNVWHSATWTPPEQPQATEPPVAPVSIWVDWTRYATLGDKVFLPLIRNRSEEDDIAPGRGNRYRCQGARAGV